MANHIYNNVKVAWGLLLMSWLLSGCGIYGKYKPVATDMDNAYGTGEAVSEALGQTSVGDLSWRAFFADPLLQQLIDTALERNTDLQSARLAVEQTQVTLSSARMAYLPSLSFNPSGTLSSFDHSTVSKTYTLPIQLDMQLCLFGSLTNLKRQASALHRQSKFQEEATRANLIAVVAQHYNQLLVYDRQLDILLSTEKLWAASLDVQRALMENGKAYSTAVNQMEASYLDVQMKIVDTRKHIHSLELSLCRLLAQTPQHIRRSTWGAYSLPHNFGVGVPATVLSQRSDVRVAELAMEAAYYNTAAARSAFYPTLSLDGMLGWTNNGDGVSNPGALLWRVVGSLTQPIFARGKLLANLKVSKLTQQDVANRYVQTVINAGNQVNEALADCQASQQKDVLLKRRVAVLQAASDGTHELMNNGKANYLEVLTAQEALLQAQLSEALNLYEGTQSLIALYLALGGATH